MMANQYSNVFAPSSSEYKKMVDEGFRLISISQYESRWMTEGDILDLIRTEQKFMDITDQDLESLSSLVAPKKYDPPAKPAFQKYVEKYSANISQASLKSWLTEFTSFKTRYYQSTYGAESAQWLYDQAVDIAKLADDSSVKVTVKKFEHPFPQFSVIARIEAVPVSGSKASGKRKKQSVEEDLPIVILGAHEDSVNQWNPWWGAAPGADDDGSGSVTIFEAYKVLVSNGFVPKRPVEFHWYAAEEGGLLGSQKVAAKYKQDNVKVFGVFHSDMTGYKPEDKDEVIALATDFTDKDLTAFMRKLVEQYADVKWFDTKCGYACSDHASWTKAGYTSAFSFEADFDDHSPYIHTTNDDVSHISFSHVAKFSKIVVAFAVEMSWAA
ncbi:Leucine aminopeptidase 1 [Blyttiomyces sp. JEL0837]|nr:Leucine aminopeptidase 1 [Blyttiomyces sp. JEL0837]